MVTKLWSCLISRWYSFEKEIFLGGFEKTELWNSPYLWMDALGTKSLYNMSTIRKVAVLLIEGVYLQTDKAFTSIHICCIANLSFFCTMRAVHVIRKSPLGGRSQHYNCIKSRQTNLFFCFCCGLSEKKQTNQNIPGITGGVMFDHKMLLG